ncbi:hypothetical protein LIER_11430 [Lithospermum erythrorhizon]|uniref:Uncharacterized protein n=1 Tax=Lithospermum erythrorhizon TaxID=34254 RepID=A0AAV3PPX9_LITER
MEESLNLEEILKPFYQRASEAEERLARLEAADANNKGSSGNEQLPNVVTELQSQLEQLKAERAAEKEKDLKEIKQLTEDNDKLHYRITHLVRGLKEALDRNGAS